MIIMSGFKRFISSLLTLILCIAMCPIGGFAEQADEIQDSDKASDNSKFKVVGYYSEIFKYPVDEVQFDKLTHIVYAFLIPGEDGSLIGIEKPEKLKELVQKSHQNGVKVTIAIGGWSYKNIPLDPNFEKLASSEDTRKLFIKNVVEFAKEYDLDGVELDWEYPDPGESALNYEKLVVSLGKALDDEGKYLTAALNGAWSKTEGPKVSEAVSDSCLESFDWINVMSYDINNQQHSPYWHTETSIDYWLNRGVAKEKLVIGMPFYARPSWNIYRDLVAENPENAYKDYAKGDPLDSYYNGIPTIKEKTRLALEKCSGVMCFDINEDTNDEYSLLKAIDDTIRERESGVSDGKIYFMVDGNELEFSEEEGYGAPFIDENNRTLIPVRKPLETIGAIVTFDPDTKIVRAQRQDVELLIPLNSDTISVNGTSIVMDTKSIVKDSRTYIPLRYVFENFGYKIIWHESSRTVIVNKNA